MYQKEVNPDDTLAIKFFKKSVLDKIETNKQGRKVFNDVDFVSIKSLDDKFFAVEKPVNNEIKARFAVRWERYKEKNENKAVGTPLDLLTFLSPANIQNLNAINIETIEQLSSLGESGIKQIINGRDMVNKAKRFLEGEHYVKSLESRIEELELKLKELGKPKRTRKKKDESTNDSTECK